MRSDITEHAIQLQIIEYLKLQFPAFYCWRNNSGAYQTQKGHYVQFGKKGSADIIGISPDGRFVALEVKKPGEKPKEHQKEFLEEILTRGGIAGVVTSIEDVKLLLFPLIEVKAPDFSEAP